MNLSRRNMLKAGAAALVTAPLTTKADANDFWNQHRRPIPQSMKDGPSSALDASGVVTMPARQVPVYRKCDVLVVGGGIAGWAAALAAARAGSKTILLERDEALGGLWSNGGVLILLSTGFMQDGKYFQTTRGFTDELEKRLLAMGPHGITARQDDKRLWHPTADPEALKIALEEMLAEAGCEVLYRCHGIDVVQDGNALKGAVVETKEGRLAVLARQVVDATGDGDVLFQAGENYQQYLHGVGFTWRIGGYDKMDLVKLRKAGLWGGGEEPCSDTRWYGEFGVPMNCFDVAGISKVLAKHRRTAWKCAEDIRKVPGCESAHLVWTATQVGIRGARTLDGLKSIDRAWAKADKDEGDTVAFMGADAKSPRGSRVPYGCLVPKKVDNLLVAGRCASCADDMVDLFRLIAPCLVTGQAAGAAAAVAAQKSLAPRNVPVKEIQNLLLKQGAYLG